MPRLSEFSSDDVQPLSTEEKPLRLSELSSDEVTEALPPSKAKSIAGGLLRGMTGGYADELAGAVLGSAKGGVKAILGSGSDDVDVQKYQKARDLYRALENKSAKTNPITTTAAEIGGAVAGPGKALHGLKGLRAILTAAGLGGAVGLGESHAELADKEYGKAAMDTGVGAAVGGGMQYGANKLFPVKSTAGAQLPASASTETLVDAGVPTASREAVKKAQGLGAKIFSSSRPAPNAEEIVSAVKTLAPGAKIPGYMLTRDETAQNLASTVLKAPTVAGELERRSLRPITESLDEFGQVVASKGSPLSQFQTGESVRKGISDEFAKRLAPAEKIYDQIESEFSSIPLNRVAFKRAIKAMRGEAKSTDLQGRQGALLDKLENLFGNVEDVGALRKMRTTLGQNLEQSATPAERKIIEKMYDVLTRERNRSILRYEQSTPKKEGLLKSLREADDIYRRELRDTSAALGVDGGRRETTRQAIGAFLKDTPAEDITKRLFERGDFAGLKRLQGSYPEQFEELRQRALGELIEKSSYNGVVSPQRLVTNLNKYGPEVQEMILGDMLPKAKAAKTVLGALPRNFNPSDTATKMQFMDLFNPKVQAQSMGARAILHAKTPSESVLKDALGPAAQGGVQVIQKLSASGQKGAQFVEPLIRAAQRGENSFGVTYFLLHQNHPEFRAAIGEDE